METILKAYSFKRLDGPVWVVFMAIQTLHFQVRYIAQAVFKTKKAAKNYAMRDNCFEVAKGEFISDDEIRLM